MANKVSDHTALSILAICPDVPIIHADENQDDTLGWVAALGNQRFIFDGKIYEPGEDVFVDRVMNYHFSVGSMYVDDVIPSDIDDTWIVAVFKGGRNVSFIAKDGTPYTYRSDLSKDHD